MSPVPPRPVLRLRPGHLCRTPPPCVALLIRNQRAGRPRRDQGAPRAPGAQVPGVDPGVTWRPSCRPGRWVAAVCTPEEAAETLFLPLMPGAICTVAAGVCLRLGPSQRSSPRPASPSPSPVGASRRSWPGLWPPASASRGAIQPEACPEPGRLDDPAEQGGCRESVAQPPYGRFTPPLAGCPQGPGPSVTVTHRDLSGQEARGAGQAWGPGLGRRRVF